MPLTHAQHKVLTALYQHPSGRPFKYADELEAIDQLCRMVPPLVCDPHNMDGALFTRITDEGRTALLDDKTAVERMADRDLLKSH